MIFSFCVVNKSFANNAVLNEEIVINSAIEHYPKIYINEEKIRIAEAKLIEARGAFDTKLNIKDKRFLSGYYENQEYVDGKIIKPLEFFNSKIYTGYLQSKNGIYPEYNQYYSTNSNGRMMFGFELSLLRGFLINEQNAIKNIANLDVKITSYNNILMLNQIKADARKSYWKFFYIKKIYKIYQEMLDIAIERQKALEIQVKKGDKPAIFLKENQRAILRRQSMLMSIQREMLNSAVNLSMYLRDKNSEMYDAEYILSMNIQEDLNDIDLLKNHNLKKDIDNVLQNRLDIKITEILLKQGNIKMKLAKNDIMPSVDLSFETYKDYGIGSAQKNIRSNKVSLDVTIPIENKKQQGKYDKTRSDIKIITYDLKLLKDSIQNEVKLLFNRVKEIEQIAENAKQEIVLSKKLLDAENIRFKNGDSDFFMVNAREQDFLGIQEYSLRNKLALLELSIEYNFVTKDSLYYN